LFAQTLGEHARRAWFIFDEKNAHGIIGLSGVAE
jgi:hypothetical protein